MKRIVRLTCQLFQNKKNKMANMGRKEYTEYEKSINIYTILEKIKFEEQIKK